MSATNLCSVCKKDLPLSEFGLDPKGNCRYSCKTCQKKRRAARKVKNPEKYRKREKEIRSNPEYKKYRKNRHLEKKFGITLDEYNLMFLKQQGKCLICNTHQRDLKSSLGVDHDHDTGKVRGLLCFNCNIGIGYLKHDTEILSNAIDYLTE